MFSSNTSQVSGAANYIEDVFSTWLYTGNGSTQTITNGIDLSTKGGLVWGKDRINAGTSHILIDTNRWSAGANALLYSDLTNSQQGYTQAITAFSTTGFTLGNGVGVGGNNASGTNYVSWTFRKQAKFFDVVTYTGNGSASRAISHNLGSAPGFIIVKCLSDGFNWLAYHRSTGATKGANFNGTGVFVTSSTFWNDTEPTSTNFTVGNSTQVNNNGSTYVAYLFAHDAGGFGLTGTDNVISCGSFTTDGSGNASVTLGYEPQWVMWKMSSLNGTGWWMFDTMRGMTVEGQNDALLQANSSGAEIFNSDYASPNATGFTVSGVNGSQTFIYIAIRRGPMKTPTTGTSVFLPKAYTGAGFSLNKLTGASFSPDTFWPIPRPGGVATARYDKLRGTRVFLYGAPSGAAVSAEETDTSGGDGLGYQVESFNNDGVSVNRSNSQTNQLNIAYIGYMFGRAPGFFDVVCYSGTSGTRTVTHNLGVVPELMIFKSRTTSAGWPVYVASLGNNKGIELNTTGASYTTSDWNNTTPTSTVFTLAAGGGSTNDSGVNYVAYLFASCPGVSKVGSYTGTGALQTINCGFTGGARFVLIKRTDSTGDWFVYDSARGITSGNDPYLLLNSTAAEDTGTNYVDTTSVGFQVTAAAPAGLNANGGTYIYLAIA